MLISPRDLLPAINAGKIIHGLGSRDLTNPEGVGFDLRLAALSALTRGSGSLRTDTRRTPDTEPISADIDGLFRLEPGLSYLATTKETFALPDDIAAFFFPRSTLFRSGMHFQSSVLPPGYIGPMTFALHNAFSEPFEMQLHARFAHVVLIAISGEVNKYRGQWQGGRVSQPKDEGQV